jgi:hypothetical protein
MSFLGSLAGMAVREGAEAGIGYAARRAAGKIAAEKAAEFAASKIGQRAAARVVGERGAQYLASQCGQRATKFVIGHETKKVLKGGDGDGGSGSSAPTPITAAPASDIQPTAPANPSRTQQASQHQPLRLMGGKSWWQMGSVTDAQKVGYDWRNFNPDTVERGASRSWGLGNAFKTGVSNAIVKNVQRGVDTVEIPGAQDAIGPGSIGALGQGVREGRRTTTTAFPQLGPGPSYEGTSSRSAAFDDGRVNGAIPVAPPAPLNRGPLVVPPPRALGPGATAPVYQMKTNPKTGQRSWDF